MLLVVGVFSCSSGEKADISDVQVALLNQQALGCSSPALCSQVKKKIAFFLKKPSVAPLLRASLELTLARLDLKDKRAFLAQGHFELAVRWASLENQPSVILSEAYLGLAQLLPLSSPRLPSLLEKMHPENLTQEDQFSYSLLKARLLTEQQHYWDALNLYAQMPVLHQDVTKKNIEQIAFKAFQDRLEIIEPMRSSVFAELFLGFFVQVAQQVDSVALKKGCDELIQHFSSSSFLSFCPLVVADQKEAEPVFPRKIGLLLPMTGRFSSQAEDTLNAVQMGFRLFASGLDVSERVELVIEDTADDNSLLSSAVRKLIEVDKVVAIIGPLLSKDMDLCAVEAKKAGIPLVTLARRGLVEGEGFFHFGLSVYNEAYELVRLAKQQLGIKRVAIVTSTDKNSQDTGFLFWDAAVMQGLTVAGFQTYQPQDTDFRYVVDKLSGLYYTHSRLDELLKMEQLRVQNKIQKKTRKNQQYYMLPPIVDYDAVFFADGARIATQIMPTFSYRDIDSVRFLGLSQWNTGDFFSRVENAAGLSFFTDMGFENPFFQRLKKGFFQDYQKSLDSLVVSGYEAAVFLKQAMKGKEMMTRSSLLQEMQRLFSEKQNSAFALNCFYQQLTLYTVKNQAAVNSSCL